MRHIWQIRKKISHFGTFPQLERLQSERLMLVGHQPWQTTRNGDSCVERLTGVLAWFWDFIGKNEADVKVCVSFCLIYILLAKCIRRLIGWLGPRANYAYSEIKFHNNEAILAIEWCCQPTSMAPVSVKMPADTALDTYSDLAFAFQVAHAMDFSYIRGWKSQRRYLNTLPQIKAAIFLSIHQLLIIGFPNRQRLGGAPLPELIFHHITGLVSISALKQTPIFFSKL